MVSDTRTPPRPVQTESRRRSGRRRLHSGTGRGSGFSLRPATAASARGEARGPGADAFCRAWLCPVTLGPTRATRHPGRVVRLPRRSEKTQTAAAVVTSGEFFPDPIIPSDGHGPIILSDGRRLTLPWRPAPKPHVSEALRHFDVCHSGRPPLSAAAGLVQGAC